MNTDDEKLLVHTFGDGDRLSVECAYIFHFPINRMMKAWKLQRERVPASHG